MTLESAPRLKDGKMTMLVGNKKKVCGQDIEFVDVEMLKKVVRVQGEQWEAEIKKR